MKNLELRSSLIKSGCLLGLLVFLIYAFAVESSGGIGGTISSLFSGGIFIVGLSIALLVSVVVMFGVYFGILYLYDPQVSVKTMDELKVNLNNVSTKIPIFTHCCSRHSSVPPTVVTAEDLIPLCTAQENLKIQLTTINASVASTLKSLTTLTSSNNTTNEELSMLGEKMQTLEETIEGKASLELIDDSAKKLASDIIAIKSSITLLNDKISTLESTVDTLDDGNSDDTDKAVQEKIDLAVTGLQKEIATLKKCITAQPVTSEETNTGDTSHRILSFFTKKDDKKKFIALVNESVEKDMTYAQANTLLNETLSKTAAAIIAEHPSLTKDYIREMRQKV